MQCTTLRNDVEIGYFSYYFSSMGGGGGGGEREKGGGEKKVKPHFWGRGV